MVMTLDFNDTITAYPTELRHLAHAVIADGGQVHIVSAVMPRNIQKTKDKIKHAGIPHTSAVVFGFVNYDDIPQKKLVAVRKLASEIHFDDNPAVCFLLGMNGILALRVEGFSKRGTL